ncbi:sodium-dependent glucose transporter 1A [Patella vulgata]|uniref:sodium-dependent glucose transporter 1A n=1 Tax=Patella vulgata TaxID=6465 RepID=UPI0021802D3B|nr:sodium-dependent glucose transporter 1A [Patella vulgata]XP_050408584.1 sodium-dependent glucose transporter 1A [Patella vulgata]
MEDGNDPVQNDTSGKDNPMEQLNEEYEEAEQSQSFLQRMENGHYRIKFFRTVAILFGFVTHGIVFSQRGPSFLDLQLITDTDVEKASTYFTATAVGYMSGSFAGGVLFDRFNSVILLFLPMFGLSLSVIVIPLCSYYGLMLTMMFVSAVFMGWYDTAGNADVVATWGAEGHSYIQIMNFMFAVGGLIAPLITEPFLSYPADDSMDSSSVIPPTESSNTSFTFPVLTNTSSFPEGFNNYSDVKHVDSSGETRLIYAYIISGLLTFHASLPFFVLFLNDKMHKKMNKKLKSKDTERPRKRDLPLTYFILTIVFINAIYFFDCAVEDTFSGYLLTFVVMQLKWNKSQGSLVTSVYWGSFAVLRFIGIFLIRCLTPVKWLFIFTSALTVSLFGFFLCAKYELHIGVWLFTALVGASISIIFATGLNWIEQSVLRLTGKVLSSIIIAGACGSMLNPLIIGHLMQELTPMWFCYLFLIEIVLYFLFFGILFYFSRTVLIKVRYVTPTEQEIGEESSSIQKAFLENGGREVSE